MMFKNFKLDNIKITTPIFTYKIKLWLLLTTVELKAIKNLYYIPIIQTFMNVNIASEVLLNISN